MRTHARFRSSILALAAALIMAAGGGLTAQESGEANPGSDFLLAGYGSATYDAMLGDQLSETRNDFTASVSPVLLYSQGEDLLFEAELEFGLSGELTTTTLEYAQADYLGFERLQFTAGKFLLPFGLFGERLHPTWINRLPTTPLLFGHAHGGVADDALMPILSDAGLMGRFNQPLGEASSLNISAWVSQGPRLVTDEDGGEADDGHAHSIVPSSSAAAVPGHGEAESSVEQSPFEIPDVGFGVAFADNNANKMLGARVGYVRPPGFEVHLSGFHAMYDPDNHLDYTGLALSTQGRALGFQFLGEAVLLRQEFATGETTFETVDMPGYYLEAARQIGSFQPVVRWSHLLDAEVNGATARSGTEELTLGLNYWISSTAPVKIAYLVDPDADDRVVVQWAFGF